MKIYSPWKNHSTREQRPREIWSGQQNFPFPCHCHDMFFIIFNPSEATQILISCVWKVPRMSKRCNQMINFIKFTWLYQRFFLILFISEKEKNPQIFTTFLLYKSWKMIRTTECILYHHLLFVIIIYRMDVLEMWRFITPSKIIFPSGVDMGNTILLGEYIFKSP